MIKKLFCSVTVLIIFTAFACSKDEKNENAPIITYMVTFNSMGGSTVDSQVVDTGSTITEPATPILTGYVFCGWYTNTECTQIWNFYSDTVDDDITLYAAWGTALFDFETGIELWLSEDDDVLALSHNTNTSFVQHGAGSVKGVCNIAGTDIWDARAVFRYDPTSAIDLTGHTLRFIVYIPESLANLGSKYGSKLWLRESGGGWSQMDGPAIDKAGWNLFVFKPVGINEDDVTTVAFQIGKVSGTDDDWSGDIYYDFISW